jgi:tRNA(Ile)-lysidine synthase
VGRRTALPGGVELVDQGDLVLVQLQGSEPAYPDYPQLTSIDNVALSVPGRIPLQGGGTLAAQGPGEPPATWARSKGSELDPVAWLDAARLPGPLLVRPARAGDRMRPLGMEGHRKLGDIFNSLHSPPAARKRWPVVHSGAVIVWLVGLRIGDGAVTRATRRAIRSVGAFAGRACASRRRG